MARFDPEAEYRKQMGDDAHERQKKLGQEFYTCCAQRKKNGHSIHCTLHPLRKKS